MCASQRFHNKMSVQTSFSYPWELLFQNIICEHFNLRLTYLTMQPIGGSLSLMLGCHVIKANSSSLRLLPSLLTSQSLNYLSTTRSGQTMETSSFTLTIIVGLLDLEHYQLKWSCQQQVKGRASHSSRLRLMSCLEEGTDWQTTQEFKRQFQEEKQLWELGKFSKYPGLTGSCVPVQQRPKQVQVTHTPLVNRSCAQAQRRHKRA